MGVNLRDLFPQHPVPTDWYHGKRIAVDGHNVAFRYLTSIRGRDGDVLRNGEGRVTGHLLGFLGLVRQLRSVGAEPVIVWDGDVHPRKEATVQERIRRRLDAQEKADAAREAGDHAAYARYARMSVYLDGKMIEDCSRLLEALGVPVVRADHDGERYAAALCHAGHTDAVATEDFDALVAGAPHVLRKAGSPQAFLHRLTDLGTHGLDQSQLRHIAILCGTDWHPGVKGFGAKTAVKALREHNIRTLIQEADTGVATTRWHRMLAAGGLPLEEFDALDAFIADMPVPPAPKAPHPSPDMAAAVAEEMGVGRDRVLACFC